MTNPLDRRTVIKRVGTVAAAGALAGCSGGGGGGGGGDGGDGGSQSTPSTTPSRSEVQNYVSASSNYDGETTVLTGRDSVSVAVGAEGNGGSFAYDPPAIKISTGTTVTWEWTGNGGAHNVVATEGTFDSGSTQNGSDVTFEYTFEETGTYLYYCTPHRGLGMKGAVVVV